MEYKYLYRQELDKHNALKELYFSLGIEHEALKEDNKKARASLQKLKAEYDELQRKYTQLVSPVLPLIDSVEKMAEPVQRIEEIMDGAGAPEGGRPEGVEVG